MPTWADNIPPTISAVLVTNPNTDDWYNQDAVITYTWMDNIGGSGLAATACPSIAPLVSRHLNSGDDPSNE